jgi:hypothetical protein
MVYSRCGTRMMKSFVVIPIAILFIRVEKEEALPA